MNGRVGQKERERIFHLLIDSSHRHNTQGWVKPKRELGVSFRCPAWVEWAQALVPSFDILLATSLGSWIAKGTASDWLFSAFPHVLSLMTFYLFIFFFLVSLVWVAWLLRKFPFVFMLNLFSTIHWVYSTRNFTVNENPLAGCLAWMLWVPFACK